MLEIPSVSAVKANSEKIKNWVLRTPVWKCTNNAICDVLGDKGEIYLKLELFQRTGSFKARGAITTLLHQDKTTLEKGIVAASAGNHAIAVSYAAKVFGTNATVIMPKAANKIKMQRAKDFGAELILVDSMKIALEKMCEIAQEQQRFPIHPFEGPLIALGTGTIGLEITEQIEDFDAVIIPVGGGGLCGGIAAVVKQISPKCLIYGVEPFGANAMFRSFEKGEAVVLDKVDTIAESLATPYVTPYTYGLSRKFMDEIICVEDAMMVEAMKLFFYEMKLAVEPAAASGLAALMYALPKELKNKRVVLILSGTNIDLDRYCQLMSS